MKAIGKISPASILIPVGLFVGWLVYSKKKAIDTLNYIINGVGLKFDGITPILKVNLFVQNVSNESFIINSIVASLYANNKYLGNVSNFAPVNILPASQIVLPLEIRLSLTGIASDIVSMITNGGGIMQNILLDGYINASGIVAPLKLNYKIG